MQVWWKKKRKFLSTDFTGSGKGKHGHRRRMVRRRFEPGLKEAEDERRREMNVPAVRHRAFLTGSLITYLREESRLKRCSFPILECSITVYPMFSNSKCGKEKNHICLPPRDTRTMPSEEICSGLR